MDVVLRVALHFPIEPFCPETRFHALDTTVPSSSLPGIVGVPLLVGEVDKFLAYVSF